MSAPDAEEHSPHRSSEHDAVAVVVAVLTERCAGEPTPLARKSAAAVVAVWPKAVFPICFGEAAVAGR
jgi:hypothetical protein